MGEVFDWMNVPRRRRLDSGGFTVKAAMFNGALSQFMGIADNAALSMGAGVHPTFVGWFYPRALPTTPFFLSKIGSGSAATTEYFIQINISGVAQFRVSNGTTIVTAAASPLIAPGQWHFFAAQYDGVNIGISVNSSPFGTAASADIQDSTNAFRLGLSSAGLGPFYGAISQVGVAKSVLSSAELNELFNGGRGKSFAQISAALAAKFTAYWDLDDAGGSGATWLDKASTNHLTAGTTTAAPTAVVLRR